MLSILAPAFLLIFYHYYPTTSHLHWSPDAHRRYYRNYPSAAGGPFFNFPPRWAESIPAEVIFESGFLPFGHGNNEEKWQSEEAAEEDIGNLLAIFTKMNWTRVERQMMQQLKERWQFEDLLNFIYAKVLELPETERTSALALLERYSPPKSLVQALEAMTAEQKGHIQELMEAGRRRRARDLRKISQGLVASLPDESQEQANRFIEIANNFLHLW